MKLDIVSLDSKIRSNLYNPQNIFKDSLEAFSDASSGTMVAVNATTPFANLMMYIATQSAISNDQIERAARRMLPEYANSRSELAPHFDYDTLQTIYASPSSVNVNLLLTLDEVMASAIDGGDGSTYLIIPKESTFTYKTGEVFGLHHDIKIRILNRDTMDVYYLENDNPLMDISVPFIKTSRRSRFGVDMDVVELLSIEFPVYNFSSTTEYRSVTSSSGFKETFTLVDQLYHIRVHTVINGNRIELLTAHGDFKYNPNSDVPIIVMQYITDTEIQLKIPDVFIDRGMIGSEITIQIMETKGDLTIDMANDGTYNFTPVFTNNDAAIEDGVVAIRSIVNLGAYSDTDPAGGVDTPTLQELITRVLAGVTDNDALTETQLEVRLNEVNYDLGHELNYIGNNVFTASNRVTEYMVGDIGTLVGTSSIQLSMQSLIGKAGVYFPDDDKVLITPHAIINGGGIEPNILTVEEVANLGSIDTNTLISRVNNENLLTPIYYYLLDTSNNNTTFGAFDLDNPEIDNPDYMASNLNNTVKMATEEIYINSEGGSYFIHLKTTGNKSALDLADGDIMAQVSTADEYGVIYSVNAEFQSRDSEGNYLFRAELVTEFNVAMDGTIEIVNMVNSISDIYSLPLEAKFYINYIVTNPEFISTDVLIEDRVNPDALPNSYSVITLEETTIKVGELLYDLFTPVRTIAAEESNEVYTEDVPALWEYDVYEMDGNVRKMFDNTDYDSTKPVSSENAPVVPRLIYKEGDAVLDSSGSPTYEHLKGDVVLDGGSPIKSNDGGYNYAVVLQGLDYKFTLINHLESIQQEIKANLVGDVRPISEVMIQDTYLRYTVGNSTGDVEILIDNTNTSTISSEITMQIAVKVSASTYTDSTLRSSIVALIKGAVSNHLMGSSYVENALVDEINDVIQSSVVSFKIISVSNLTDVQSFQLVNNQDNMGVKSILGIDDTGEYEILDGIEVTFISM